MHRIANLLNIQKIVTIHYQELPEGYVSKEETHDFWEIIYADKGGVDVVRDGERSRLRQGEVVFIEPNRPHYVESGRTEPNIFIVSFECRSEGMGFFRDKVLSVPENYRYLLQNIMSEATETFVIPDFDPDLNKLELRPHPNLGGEQVIKNSLELLLVYLLRAASGQSAPQEFFISKISSSSDLQDEIVRILSERLYDRFELDDLCSRLHYGKTYLCTFFREKTESMTQEGLESGQWTVDQPSDDMKAAMQEISEEIWEESREKYGDEIMDVIISGEYRTLSES